MTFSRDFVVLLFLDNFEYGKCFETGEITKSLEYRKCQETGETTKSLEYGKCLETRETTKFLNGAKTSPTGGHRPIF